MYYFTKIDETDKWEEIFVKSLLGGRIIATYFFSEDKILHYLGTELKNCPVEDQSKILQEFRFFDYGIEQGVQVADLIDQNVVGKPFPGNPKDLDDVWRVWKTNKELFNGN
jgi:hypothetical protein